jgi:arginine N-succinyltransferase
MNFQEADAFNAINGHQFIADLMPKHPIYTAMLSESARAAIGMPHPSGRAAMRMLENEGFAFEKYIDIFDGGPTMTARIDAVRSVREAKEAAVIAANADAGIESLVAHGRLSDFRCAFGTVAPQDAGVALDPACAAAIHAQDGDKVLHVERI